MPLAKGVNVQGSLFPTGFLVFIHRLIQQSVVPVAQVREKLPDILVIQAGNTDTSDIRKVPVKGQPLPVYVAEYRFLSGRIPLS